MNIMENNVVENHVTSSPPTSTTTTTESAAASATTATSTSTSSVRTNKVVVRQLPNDIDWSDFEQLLTQHGEVIQCDHAGSPENPSAIVTFKTSDEANSAAEKLNNHEYNGQVLKVTMAVDRIGRNTRRGGGGGRPAGDDGGYNYGGGGGMRPSGAEMPLRMVVNAKCVGAIIGQGGSNIRQITKESKARCVVDVSRGIRDNAGNMEKVINIYGTPDNASKACMKILDIVHQELQKEPANQGKTLEPELKLRAHNNLVGRLIGKGGGTIKKIMEETGCTIFVSNISELSAFNMERTITIRGQMDKIAQAEQKISAKLRQCWENDIVNAPHTMYGGMHPLMAVPQYGAPAEQQFGGPYSPVGMMPAGTMGGANAYAAGPAGLAGGPSPGATGLHGGPLMGGSGGPPGSAGPGPMTAGPPAGALLSVSPQQQGPNVAGNGSAGFTEVVHIWVPNNIVGALIGNKGAHIRSVMRLTGAHIRIETGGKPEPGGGGGQQQGGGDRRQQTSSQDAERRVTITGTDQQQYKAQFWIFQRVCEQGYHFFDEVRLCTEIQVPSKMVGRIIGKGGQNVRELQRITGAQVKIPEDAGNENAEDTVVRIVGNFNAAQAVQARVRQLMHLMQNRLGN